ncbi:MAG: Crp/Fnr family transcriptional regulator [Thermaceae bacterium]|nr:Crp/Fnr family transcriptional regulator [Thermaceae bacterium]
MTPSIPVPVTSVTLLPYLSPKSGNQAQVGLESLGQVYALNRGETLYQTGDCAKAIYLVLEGLIKLSRLNEFGGERVVGLMGRRDVLGLGSLRQQGIHTEEARALAPVRLISIESATLARSLHLHPNLSESLFSALAGRTLDLLELLDLAQAPVLIKVSKALLWLGQRFGTQAEGGCRLELGLRQEELASLVGVQRPTMTHTLTLLRDLGLVRGSRGVYWLDQKGLQRRLETLALAA